jgi:5-formyltetrahydrofolate cyclo-ligase
LSYDPRVTDSKRDWRRRLLDVRRSLTAAELQRAAEGLRETATRSEILENPRCVALYVAVPPEPETGLLLSWLESRGVRVLLPVLHDDNDLGWGASSAGLVPGRFGLSEPAVDLGVDAIADAELVLCPALAVDRAGVRLGRGGGSYDRALARVGVPTIAVLYDSELVDALPSDAHDRRVTHVLTPSRLTHL